MYIHIILIFIYDFITGLCVRDDYPLIPFPSSSIPFHLPTLSIFAITPSNVAGLASMMLFTSFTPALVPTFAAL